VKEGSARTIIDYDSQFVDLYKNINIRQEVIRGISLTNLQGCINKTALQIFFPFVYHYWRVIHSILETAAFTHSDNVKKTAAQIRRGRDRHSSQRTRFIDRAGN
jgi:hypothetical protein